MNRLQRRLALEKAKRIPLWLVLEVIDGEVFIGGLFMDRAVAWQHTPDGGFIVRMRIDEE